MVEFMGSLSPGDKLIIDCNKMTALLNGQDVRHLMKGEYPTVPPGTGELEYSDEEVSRKVRIKIWFRDRWL